MRTSEIEVSTPSILAVSGSASAKSSTACLIREVGRQLVDAGCCLDMLDLGEENLPLFNPETSYSETWYARLKERVVKADVLVLGTPDYHGCMSGVLKNFLDHFWREYAGKLVVSLVGSYEKGLTVTDQIRTFSRQCYAWNLPYGVSFMEGRDVKEGEIINEAFRTRLTMFARDIRVYGLLLAEQKKKDLEGNEPGFLEWYRKP